MTIEFTIPVRLVSEANAHEHWTIRYLRARKQRHATYWAHMSLPPSIRMESMYLPPCTVEMTRVYSGLAKPMDDDNLARAFKAIRDQIATIIGVDDGDPSVKYVPLQERGKWNEVRVRITPLSRPERPRNAKDGGTK